MILLNFNENGKMEIDWKKKDAEMTIKHEKH